MDPQLVGGVGSTEGAVPRQEGVAFFRRAGMACSHPYSIMLSLLLLCSNELSVASAAELAQLLGALRALEKPPAVFGPTKLPPSWTAEKF